MPVKKETLEICAKFDSFLKNGDKRIIEQLSLDELINADIDLGWRDQSSSSRLAIKNRIEEIKNIEIDKKNTTKHKQILKAAYISIICGIIIALLTWAYF